jgi:hypothetical protein
MTEDPAAAGSAVHRPSEDPSARRFLGTGLVIALVIAAFGLVARLQMIAWGLVFPGPVNVYFRLYALHEPLFLVLLLVWTLGAAAASLRRAPTATGGTRLERLVAPSPRAVAILAGAVFVLALVTWYRVHHAVLLTMDEFTTDFQARILARGELRATLPLEWQPYVDALAPVFTAYQGLDGGWLSQYLPGYALLRTPFLVTGSEVQVPVHPPSPFQIRGVPNTTAAARRSSHQNQ